MTQTVQEAIEHARENPGEVVFYSKFPELKLIRVPRNMRVLATGQQEVIQESLHYQFRAHVLVVRVGQDELVDGTGWLANDQDGRIKRDAPDALRAHRTFNTDFWEEGQEPGRPLPSDVDFNREVREALMRLDEEALEALYQQERDSHARPSLLANAHESILAVRDMKAEVERRDAEDPGNVVREATGERPPEPEPPKRATRKREE